MRKPVALTVLALLWGACSDGYVGKDAYEAAPLDASMPNVSGPDAGVSSPVRGAVYFPVSAYNVDQMWMEYDPRVTERDFGYAATIHLNALRIFGSFAASQQDASQYARNIDDLLSRAEAAGMRVLFVVFESSGLPGASEAARELKDPLLAVAVQSPPLAITSDPAARQPLREHLQWFMGRYRNDARLLGIEVVNQPEGSADFAHEMLALAVAERGSVPLTLGTTGEDVDAYLAEGLDVIEFHNNFPESLEASRANIEASLARARAAKRPLWMTEWQRIRPTGTHYTDDTNAPADERYPDLASMAAQVKSYESEIGSFFWGLMVKPAYLQGQRNAGTVNGLFWADGAVWDLAAARILADDPSLVLTERRRVPFEVLRLDQSMNGLRLSYSEAPDGTGAGQNVHAVATGVDVDAASAWRLVRIDGESYFRLENVLSGRWLECTREPDATDAAALSVRAIEASNIGDETRWRWLPITGDDTAFVLENKATGHYLEVASVPDADGSGGQQVRAAATSTDASTHFRSRDAGR